MCPFNSPNNTGPEREKSPRQSGQYKKKKKGSTQKNIIKFRDTNIQEKVNLEKSKWVN